MKEEAPWGNPGRVAGAVSSSRRLLRRAGGTSFLSAIHAADKFRVLSLVNGWDVVLVRTLSPWAKTSRWGIGCRLGLAG